MKHNYYSQDGRKFSVDGEIPYSHIVMGQRDEEAARKQIPETRGKTNRDFSAQELADIAKFTYDSTHGWYAFKPLAWASSEDEANALAEKFKADNWINVEVKQINQQHTIKYA